MFIITKLIANCKRDSHRRIDYKLILFLFISFKMEQIIKLMKHFLNFVLINFKV